MLSPVAQAKARGLRSHLAVVEQRTADPLALAMLMADGRREGQDIVTRWVPLLTANLGAAGIEDAVFRRAEAQIERRTAELIAAGTPENDRAGFLICLVLAAIEAIERVLSAQP